MRIVCASTARSMLADGGDQNYVCFMAQPPRHNPKAQYDNVVTS